MEQNICYVVRGAYDYHTHDPGYISPQRGTRLNEISQRAARASLLLRGQGLVGLFSQHVFTGD